MDNLAKLHEEYRSLNHPNSGYFECQCAILAETEKAICFDIDEPGVYRLTDTVQMIRSMINPDCLTFVKTRGGCHCLIEVNKIKKEYAKTWHKNITSLPNVDQISDQLLPVVGCCLGGFVPFVYYTDL